MATGSTCGPGVTVPLVPIGAFSPAGRVVANLDDVAAWARLQLRRAGR